MLRQLTACFALVVAGGCQSGGIVERLDRDTGLTLVTDPKLKVFARTETRLSRSARDYIYLGPVEVNERGRRSYYLWVGVASTIDRSFLSGESSMPEVLYVDLQGAPMEFELAPWGDRVRGLSADSLYDSAVTPEEVFAARVTLDQLSLIADGAPERIRVGKAQQPSIEYFVWGGHVEWPGFLANAGISGVR